MKRIIMEKMISDLEVAFEQFTFIPPTSEVGYFHLELYKAIVLIWKAQIQMIKEVAELKEDDGFDSRHH